jgi:hypothetical protein
MNEERKEFMQMVRSAHEQWLNCAWKKANSRLVWTVAEAWHAPGELEDLVRDRDGEVLNKF